MRILLIASMLLLAGCAISQDTNVKAFLTACSGYHTALSSLAGYRAAGKLSDAQVATVDRLRPGLNRACLNEPDVSVAALAVVQSGLAQLIMIEGTVR